MATIPPKNLMGNLYTVIWLRKEEIMKTKIGVGRFHLTNSVLFFIFILIQSCASTSIIHVEGNDFKENLPGRWEGRWTYGAGRSDIEYIKIIKMDGNKIHLTGFNGDGGGGAGTDEVYGRIENSTLLLSWPAAAGGACEDELRMIRDDSNNLILGGQSKCESGFNAKVRLKKIE
jgi:hypothetical protein